MLRLFTFLGVSLVFLGVFVLGSGSEVSTQEAETFAKEFDMLVGDIDAFGIFIHNELIAAIMLIPGIGVLWAMLSAWFTGYAFAALTMSVPELSQISPLAILLGTPFGLMELAAYSLSASRSVLFVVACVRHMPIRPELRILAIDGAIAAALLAAAALIEIVYLDAIGTLDTTMPI